MRNEPEAKTDARWHPATKLLVAAALLALPYLWWTGAGDREVAAPVRPAGEAGVAPVEPPPRPLEPYVLPPLEHFTAVVERPLFSPTRRMPPLPEPSSEPQGESAETPVAETGPSGPEEPELRFFGTVRDRGQMAALVTFPATNAVARLAPGDRVGSWEVVEVDRDRLVLAIGDDRRSFEIFGPNADAGAPPQRTPRTRKGAAGGTRHPVPPPEEASPDGAAPDGSTYAPEPSPDAGMADEPPPDGSSVDETPPEEPSGEPQGEP